MSLAVSARDGTPGNSRRKVNVGNKRNDTGINRVCASSQKMDRSVSLSFFPCSRSPVGNSRNKLKTGWVRCRPTGGASPRHRYAWVLLRRQQRVELRTQEPQLVPHFSFPPSAPTLAQPLAMASLIDHSPTPKQLQTIRPRGATAAPGRPLSKACRWTARTAARQRQRLSMRNPPPARAHRSTSRASAFLDARPAGPTPRRRQPPVTASRRAHHAR